MADRCSANAYPALALADPCADKPQEVALPRVVSSDTLFGGQPQLAIRHNQTIYFLRQTRFGKLILTK